MNKRGVTLLLAVLMSSIALSVGVGIFSLLFSEIEISGSIKDSMTAFYAADSGLECALYWSSQIDKDPLATDPFQTSGPANSITCNNTSFLVGGAGSCTDGPCDNASSDWYLSFADGATSCAHVTVEKENIAGIIQTRLISGGENRDRCDTAPTSLRIFQQGLRIIF